jgi:hypothetical protein
MKIDRKVNGTKQWKALELQSLRREKFVLAVMKKERIRKSLRNNRSFYSSCG